MRGHGKLWEQHSAFSVLSLNPQLTGTLSFGSSILTVFIQ